MTEPRETIAMLFHDDSIIWTSMTREQSWRSEPYDRRARLRRKAEKLIRRLERAGFRIVPKPPKSKRGGG